MYFSTFARIWGSVGCSKMQRRGVSGWQRMNSTICVGSSGNLAPVVQVAQDFPIFVAVIDDEEFAARLTGAIGHWSPPRKGSDLLPSFVARSHDPTRLLS